MSSPRERFSLLNPDGTLKSGEQLQADANELLADARARAQQVTTEIAGNTAEATSRDQVAKVTVSATGALRSIRLNDKMKQMTPVRVAASIMEAYSEATRQATERTAAILGEQVGTDRAASLMRDLLPDRSAEDEGR